MARRAALPLTTVAALACGAVVAVPAPAAAARAETLLSTNWAGYATTGARFRSVRARWTVTKMRCTRGQSGWSAAWVGLGGFTGDGRGLEQTGTDSSCDKHGRAAYAAWYELVPAPSRRVRMRVRPGNQMSATVTVRGQRVTLTLRNRTTGKRVVRRARMKAPGIASAEWVVEAPSGCNAAHHCDVLPLGDFGTTRFTHASATGAAGHSGTISDAAWTPTRIVLSEGASSAGLGSGAAALPSPLSPLGASFSVAYRSAGTFGRGPKRTFPAGAPATRTLPPLAVAR